MVKGLLYKYLLKAILGALIALILYGAFSATTLAIILVLFVGVRFISLGAEAFRKNITSEQWAKLAGDLTASYEKLPPEALAKRAASLNLDPRIAASDLAQAQIVQAFRNYTPPRAKWELSAEALGVIAFAIVIPVDIALFAREIFSLRMGQGWEGAAVAVLCVALYALPHRCLKAPRYATARAVWWAIPLALSLLFLDYAIETRHPYLNPLNPDRNRLAAERVLSLKNNVQAGQFADWVLRYAWELDTRGDSKQAIYYYRAALRLDSNYRAAYNRLATLEAQESGDSRDGVNTVSASAPYWTSDAPVTKSPRQRIDSRLENVDGCTVVIVPIGDVPDELLDAAGFVIQKELGLPVIVSSDSVPLPPHTRVPGLAIGPQWDQTVLLHAFLNFIKPLPNAPIKYLLVTTVDIYREDTNYVFSSSWNSGALLSAARFGDPNTDNIQLRERTAKQALCALLKCFNVPASTDRNCVTSYTRSLMEFDAKGNRPNVETMKLYRRAVNDMNNRWVGIKARQEFRLQPNTR